MSTLSWFAAFSIRDGVVHYRQTGARIALNASLARDVLIWLTYYAPLRLKAAAHRLLEPGPRLWFTPNPPPPWYLIWNAAAWIGARQAHTPEEADAIVYFEDATWGSGAQQAALPCINGACTDVSKSHVAEVFERVFGYPLRIDPEIACGDIVEKSELNGVHDGRVIATPMMARPGRVYQRLIETGDEECIEDLRTPCVGGEPVVVFIKRRPSRDRFANYNTNVSLAEPREVFSETELDRIRAFVREMRLDWGGLDILRERHGGRLYIVDVNKTDMPPLALPFAEKMQASQRLGRALERLILDKKVRG